MCFFKKDLERLSAEGHLMCILFTPRVVFIFREGALGTYSQNIIWLLFITYITLYILCSSL